jgi:UDP-N-acetylmuramoyl-L-alanyl-D-glutamate--2,6-diaminopimelate ligase
VKVKGSVTLGDLLAAVDAGARLVPPTAAAVMVSDVTHDSREAAPGVLFACRPGVTADGHDFAAAAVAAGSPALLVERRLPLDVPQLQVPGVADVLGPVAAAVHGNPSDALSLCGVTGTNGKTTVAYLLEGALRACGHTTGLIGTIQTLIAGASVPGVRTTPEATDLQRLIRSMLDEGVSAVALEVSSHGLALGRVAGAHFAVALFTNLSQDHLDFHADMEDYFQAKARLFTPIFTDAAVVNVDDEYGGRLADMAAVETVRVSAREDRHAAATLTDLRSGPDGSAFTAHLPGGTVDVRVRLAGHFNAANALLALAAADVLGLDLAAAAHGIAGVRGVPGRMERVDAGQPFTVLVDYAHTPDSLGNILQAAREISDGRLIVVIGCGGDRDRDKRPLMGRVAADQADLAVLTSDNPRSEDPQAILDAVAAGAREVAGARCEIELDRRAAIAVALGAAGPGDVVVIAGKGHETYQELADRTIEFDDRAVALELLGGGVT